MILVVAGNYHEYHHFLRTWGLKDRKDCTFIQEFHQMQGWREIFIAFYGTFNLRGDLDGIMQFCLEHPEIKIIREKELASRYLVDPKDVFKQEYSMGWDPAVPTQDMIDAAKLAMGG